jgi:hypothetical protein
VSRSPSRSLSPPRIRLRHIPPFLVISSDPRQAPIWPSRSRSPSGASNFSGFLLLVLLVFVLRGTSVAPSGEPCPPLLTISRVSPAPEAPAVASQCCRAAGHRGN